MDMSCQNGSIARRAKRKEYYLKRRLPAQLKLNSRQARQKALGKFGNEVLPRRDNHCSEKLQNNWRPPRRFWRGKWPLKSANRFRTDLKKSVARRETSAT